MGTAAARTGGCARPRLGPRHSRASRGVAMASFRRGGRAAMKRWWVGTAAARRAAQPSIAASRGGERAAMSRRMGRRDGEPGGVAAASVAAGSAWVRIGFVHVSSSKDLCHVFWVFLVFLVYWLTGRAGPRFAEKTGIWHS